MPGEKVANSKHVQANSLRKITTYGYVNDALLESIQLHSLTTVCYPTTGDKQSDMGIDKTFHYFMHKRTC